MQALSELQRQAAPVNRQYCLPRAQLARPAEPASAEKPIARQLRDCARLAACAVEAMAAAAMSEGEAGKALWNAAKAGNVEEATRLLEAGAPVSWADQRVSKVARTSA